MGVDEGDNNILGPLLLFESEFNGTLEMSERSQGAGTDMIHLNY